LYFNISKNKRGKQEKDARIGRLGDTILGIRKGGWDKRSLKKYTPKIMNFFVQ
jgi:hypothetical protein